VLVIVKEATPEELATTVVATESSGVTSPEAAPDHETVNTTSLPAVAPETETVAEVVVNGTVDAVAVDRTDNPVAETETTGVPVEAVVRIVRAAVAVLSPKRTLNLSAPPDAFVVAVSSHVAAAVMP